MSSFRKSLSSKYLKYKIISLAIGSVLCIAIFSYNEYTRDTIFDNKQSNTDLLSGKEADKDSSRSDFRVSGIDLDMVWVPSGEFKIGSPSDEAGRDNDEGPQSNILITNGFWIGRYEVTIRQFNIFVETTGYRTGSEIDNGMLMWTGRRLQSRDSWKFRKGYTWKNTFSDNLDNPVVGVNWNDAMAFCDWLTKHESSMHRLPEGYAYSLPTEAQWEYACRGGTSTIFAFGNYLHSGQANFDGSFPYGTNAKGPFRRKPIQVGSFSPNAWGLYDMHGNVWEWCYDLKFAYPSRKSLSSDLQGPALGIFRVQRGGCWYSSGLRCRSAFRNWILPSFKSSGLGFRISLRSISDMKLRAPSPHLP